jgi:hypothetical protein
MVVNPVSSPMELGIVPFNPLPTRWLQEGGSYRRGEDARRYKWVGMHRAKQATCVWCNVRASAYMSIISPIVPFTPFPHDTQGNRILSHCAAPPQEHGLSLSEAPHPPVASENSCQDLHWAGNTWPHGDSGGTSARLAARSPPAQRKKMVQSCILFKG